MSTSFAPDNTAAGPLHTIWIIFSTEKHRSFDLHSFSSRTCFPRPFRTVRFSFSPSHSSFPSQRGATGSDEAADSMSNSAVFCVLDPEFKTRIFIVRNDSEEVLRVCLREPSRPLWLKNRNHTKETWASVLPFPVQDFRHVDSVFVNILLMFDKLVPDELLKMSAHAP